MLEERSKIPVERRRYGTFYIVFSGILFLGTLWAVWDEVSVRRPWKAYEAEYYDLLHTKLDSLKTVALEEVDSSEVAGLKEELQKAEAGKASDTYTQTYDKRFQLMKELDVATREWRFARSRSDAAYYQYQQAMLAGKDTTSQREEVDKNDAEIAQYADQMSALQKQIGELSKIVNAYDDSVSRAQVNLAALFKTADSYDKKLEKSAEAPLEIKQTILTDYELTPFSEVKDRVDRCQTCHMGWNEDAMADAPEPFRKHPLPELLAKHNPEIFGCTPCHRGQGPALTPGTAHGDEDPYWDAPLLKGVETYASCNACHKNETVLKYAKPFTKAKQLILESGCFGCHEIKGYDNVPKIGPILNALPAKTRPDWIYRWVKNPKDYNPHTRMPNFHLSSDQAAAVTAYLVSIGKESDYRYTREKGTYKGGNAAKGKEIFETVGCQGCHVTSEFTKVREARGTSYDKAPELTRVGSKVNPDWAFDWVKNPRHYHPDTQMPSLRLSDTEARNVVAYLMTLKDDRTFPSVPLDLNNQAKIAEGADVIREYGCAGCHLIKGMEREGKVSVNLSDFGKKKVEQMDFGNTHKLDLKDSVDYHENEDGTVSVKHTWAGWVYGKLRNSRLYQTERIVQKMPVFKFSDEEIRLIRMFLLGMEREGPLEKYIQPYTKRIQDLEAGRRLTVRYNCIQCHTIEGRGGYILVKFDDPGLGPPPLPESQGAKVQEQWLHNFLKNPSTIRPWLKLRMPTFRFTDDEIGKIQKYFLAMSNVDFEIRDYAATPVEAKYLVPGKHLFESYQCAKCHPTGAVNLQDMPAEYLAPNLALAHERLKPEWIVQWLKDPQKLQPGTRMPTFFYGGEAPDAETLGGNVDEQAKALQTYVWTLRNRGH